MSANPDPTSSAQAAPNPAAAPADSSGEFVWSFRGYRLRASEFTTAMVHFFRAEVSRANIWRNRLDTTTNWAVITTGAAVSIAFAQTGNHAVILVNILLVTIFLWIEARRYRYYELWSYRVRLMETDFFAPMLVPPFQPAADWADTLSESLLRPAFPISTLEALGRRLRRNYLYIYGIIGAVWLAQLSLFPHPVTSFEEMRARAAIGPLSGGIVFGLAVAFCIAVILVGILTIRMQSAPGEVLPRFGFPMEAFPDSAQASAGEKAWFRPSRKRTQLLTMIITSNQAAVSEKILKDMKRGVTAVLGKGMYTGAEHPILLCALTVTEVPQLKAIVAELDPHAFVIVMPATEVLGFGFRPLEEEER
jgi:uncharacterized membrane protein